MTPTTSKITCAVASIFGLVVGYVLGGWVYAVGGNGFWTVLKEWQTLLTGIFAIIAAWATVIQIRRQIAQADRVEADRNSREEYAARAILPVTLSELCAYARECIDILKTLLPIAGDEISREKIRATIFPSIPAGVIPTVRDAVRFADRFKRRKIADLAAALQIQEARLEGLQEQANQPHHSLRQFSVPKDPRCRGHPQQGFKSV